MNIVIDTSAIIAVIANEPEKQKLIDLTRGAHLFAPESISLEFMPMMLMLSVVLYRMLILCYH